jgi:hypothetical protein
MTLLFGFNRLLPARVRRFVACGVLSLGAMLMAPLGAQALDFDWYFSSNPGGITRGTIKGLVEGYNSGDAVIVEVVDSPLSLALGGNWTFDSSYSSPFAFNVENGEVVAADAFYLRTTSIGLLQAVGFGLFGPGNGGNPFIYSASLHDGNILLYTFETVFGSPPVATVPAPLPVFGAAVFFGYCRRLRSRVRAAGGCSGVVPSH